MSKAWHAQFGDKVRPHDEERFEKSKQWNGERFENLIETKMDMNILDLPKLLKERFTDRKSRSPEAPIPIIPFDKEKFAKDGAPKFIWYGHSVCLLQIANKNILIDPMLGPNASPIAPFSTKRFSEASLEVIDSLPEIDVLLMTHDHYDHLDYDSILKLKEKVDTWFVGLGISRHLEKWGVPAGQITEFDWWDEIDFDGIRLVYTPSRHFSGRGAFDRAKSLWGGWVFISEDVKVYWSGDGGYGPHFKDVGDKLGPFDWGFMECGQYNKNWHAIHMYPEETVQAALDAGVSVATPVHWAGFALALHPWKEPIERFLKAANDVGLNSCTPRIGEVVRLKDQRSTEAWWEDIS